MATEISAVISWHEVLHPDIGDRGKWNFPWHGTAGQCWGRFVADGDTTGVSARRVISPTAPAQHHSQATYLADGALGVNPFTMTGRPLSLSSFHIAQTCNSINIKHDCIIA